MPAPSNNPLNNNSYNLPTAKLPPIAKPLHYQVSAGELWQKFGLHEDAASAFSQEIYRLCRKDASLDEQLRQAYLERGFPKRLLKESTFTPEKYLRCMLMRERESGVLTNGVGYFATSQSDDSKLEKLWTARLLKNAATEKTLVMVVPIDAFIELHPSQLSIFTKALHFADDSCCLGINKLLVDQDRSAWLMVVSGFSNSSLFSEEVVENLPWHQEARSGEWQRPFEYEKRWHADAAKVIAHLGSFQELYRELVEVKNLTPEATRNALAFIIASSDGGSIQSLWNEGNRSQSMPSLILTGPEGVFRAFNRLTLQNEGVSGELRYRSRNSHGLADNAPFGWIPDDTEGVGEKKAVDRQKLVDFRTRCLAKAHQVNPDNTRLLYPTGLPLEYFRTLVSPVLNAISELRSKLD